MFETLILAVGLIAVTVLMIIFRIFAGWRIWKQWKTSSPETGEPFTPDIDRESALAEN